MKRSLAILLAVLLLAAATLSGCGGSKGWTGKHDVEIKIANYGTITVEVNADAAHQHLARAERAARHRGSHRSAHP